MQAADRTLSAAPQAGALALAWAASTLVLQPPGWPANAGFLLATAFSLAAALLLARRVVKGATPPGTARRALDAALALSPLPVAFALSALLAGTGLVWALRLLPLFLAGVVALSLADEPAAARALGRAGLAVAVGLAALALASLAVPGLRAAAWQAGEHAAVGAWPRFRGWAGVPFAAGLWALLGAALAQRLPSPAARRTALACGTFVAAASLSFATVAIPQFLIVLARGRIGRCRARALAAAASVGAVLILWFQVSEVRAGGRTLTLAASEAWARDGLGPAHHPPHALRAGPLEVRVRSTVYGALFPRGLACALDHPLAGTGPGAFAQACPAPTLNTYGNWSAHRRPHNQYTALAAETGLLGLVAAALSLVLLARRRRPAPEAAPGLALLVLAGFAGEIWLTFGAVLYATSQLPPRTGAG